jgi:hypothetical protein
MSKQSKKNEVERDQFGNRLHAEKPTKNGHYMGKRCGFEYKDGRYQVAGTHYSMMEDANEQEAGIRAMMEAHNTYIGKQFQRIAEIRNRFWKGIQEDYDLPENLLYHGNGWVSIAPKEEKKFSCISCGLHGFTKETIFDHQRECKDHPLGIEIRELRAQRSRKD